MVMITMFPKYSLSIPTSSDTWLWPRLVGHRGLGGSLLGLWGIVAGRPGSSLVVPSSPAGPNLGCAWGLLPSSALASAAWLVSSPQVAISNLHAVVRCCVRSNLSRGSAHCQASEAAPLGRACSLNESLTGRPSCSRSGDANGNHGRYRHCGDGDGRHGRLPRCSVNPRAAR